MATAAAAAGEARLYVNTKQVHYILKRRVVRQELEQRLNFMSRGRKPCLQESRHRHATPRPRGPDGRYLTAAKITATENGRGGSLTAGLKQAMSGTSTRREAGSANDETRVQQSRPGDGSADEKDDADGDGDTG